MAFDTFDVVIVPFPFTDQAESKKRPALVLSHAGLFNEKAGHSVLMMITSAKNAAWPLDIPISDLKSAGLPAPSVARMKIFTLDNRLIIKKIGALSKADKQEVSKALGKVFKTAYSL